MRGLRTVMVSLLAVVSAALAQENQDHSTKNSDAVQKRRARADAKSKFEEDNGATFDAYGRTIRYGTDIDDVECKRDKPKKGESGKGEWRCKVTKSSRRKYLTKEEKVVSKQMQAEKQEEIDSAFGGAGPEAAMKKNKFKKEQRARCRVFGEWLAEFKKDAADSKHRAFFAYLKGDYEDFGAYRRIAETGGGGRKGKKKAKKLKRHIALNVHQDKLPSSCSNDEIKEMMTAIMSHLEEVEKCVEEPHKCNPQEL